MGIQIRGSDDSITAADGSLSVAGFAFPTSNGSASQYLQTNGAGVLSWATNPALFTSYAIICDEKADNVSGGTFTSGAWQTRDLNTIVDDPDGIVSLSSNQFTLSTGSYLIRWRAPAYGVSRHQTRLYNATSATYLQLGSSEYPGSGNVVHTSSYGVDRINVNAASVALEIRHRAQVSKVTNGFGVEANFGVTEIYTIVEIYKEL